MAKFRSATTTNTGTTIKSTGADVFSLSIVNRHSAAIFVKFYDSPVATFQDTPIATYQAGANATVAFQRTSPNLFGTNNGLSVRVVTNDTDSGNTAAATLPIIEAEYN